MLSLWKDAWNRFCLYQPRKIPKMSNYDVLIFEIKTSNVKDDELASKLQIRSIETKALHRQWDFYLDTSLKSIIIQSDEVLPTFLSNGNYDYFIHTSNQSTINLFQNKDKQFSHIEMLDTRMRLAIQNPRNKDNFSSKVYLFIGYLPKHDNKCNIVRVIPSCYKGNILPNFHFQNNEWTVRLSEYDDDHFCEEGVIKIEAYNCFKWNVKVDLTTFFQFRQDTYGKNFIQFALPTQSLQASSFQYLDKESLCFQPGLPISQHHCRRMFQILAGDDVDEFYLISIQISQKSFKQKYLQLAFNLALGSAVLYLYLCLPSNFNKFVQDNLFCLCIRQTLSPPS